MSFKKEIEQKDKARVTPASSPAIEEGQRLEEEEKRLEEEEKRLEEEEKRLCEKRTRLKNEVKELDEEIKKFKDEEKRLKKDKKRLKRAKRRKRFKDNEQRYLENEENKARAIREKIKKEYPGYYYSALNQAAELKSNSFWPNWIKVIGNILFGLSIVAAFGEIWYFSLLDYLPNFGDPGTIEFFLVAALIYS